MDDDDWQWRFGEDLPCQRARTLPALLRGLEAASPAMLHDGRTWSGAELWARARAIAGAWQDRVRPGERVGIVVANQPLHFCCELACWLLGAIAVPVAERQRAFLRQVSPRLCIEEVDLAGLRALPLLPGFEARPLRGEDPALILCTSGSTGTAKGVVLTHDNLCSQQAAFGLIWPEVGPQDRLLAYLPWQHSFGALAERLWALVRGVPLTLCPGGGRDLPAFLQAFQQVQPTLLMSVPRILSRLVAAPEFRPNGLRWVFSAGAVLPAAVENFFQQAGVPIYEGWGLTECSPSATITRHTRQHGEVGQPIPGVAVGVRRRDGQLFVRGPGVMAGYWRDPAATARALTPLGLATGDAGCWSPHGLRLLGRLDEICKLPNGEKVHLGSLEAELSCQPGIRHALCFNDGQRLSALIETEAETDGLPAALRRFNASRQAGFERLRSAWLSPQAWTLDNGLLTPSLKVCRAAVLASFDPSRWVRIDA